MSKVFIDAGHGGKDPGAVGNLLKEKDLTLPIALEVGEILKKHNVEIMQSRTNDTFIELTERAAMANKFNADIFVSFHINSAINILARGVETFSHIGSSKGAILAKNIQDQLVADKIFTSDRGTKTANFAVLRLTKMPAALVELGFISNSQDAALLRNRLSDMAKSVAKGILKNLGIKYNDNNPINGLPILSKTKATVEQMQEWAKRKGANQLFIDLAPIFYDVSLKAGVNPLVTYCQSAKETGYMKFGGVINASFNNPCGLKTKSGGGDKDPNAHQRFKDWEEGIQAQVDHLALYAGAPGYPKTGTPDPRHFSFIKGTAPTLESLGGKWAPSISYGTEIVKMIKEVEATVAPIKPVDPLAKDIKINLPGRIIAVKGKFKDNTNYINVKGEDIPIRDVFEAMGLTVTWENNMVVIK